MTWYPQSCPVCAGDVYDDPLDHGWVTCMMCARSFVASNVLAVQRIAKRPGEWRDGDLTPERLAS